MRELAIGERGRLSVKATPLAQLFYRQEFDSDMTSDFLRITMGFVSAFPGARGKSLETLTEADLSISDVTAESLGEAPIDAFAVLRLVWAMAKAAAHPSEWPPFETWLDSMEDLDPFKPEFIGAALEVAADGLFRGRAAHPSGLR
jgi:hypothetical protein